MDTQSFLLAKEVEYSSSDEELEIIVNNESSKQFKSSLEKVNEDKSKTVLDSQLEKKQEQGETDNKGNKNPSVENLVKVLRLLERIDQSNPQATSDQEKEAIKKSILIERAKRLFKGLYSGLNLPKPKTPSVQNDLSPEPSKEEIKYKGVFGPSPKLSLIDQSLYEFLNIPPLDPKVAEYTLLDVDIEKMDRKPWEDPSVDLTDYFNYGFNEKSWKEYLAAQIHIRSEMSKKQSVMSLEDRTSEKGSGAKEEEDAKVSQGEQESQSAADGFGKEEQNETRERLTNTQKEKAQEEKPDKRVDRRRSEERERSVERAPRDEKESRGRDRESVFSRRNKESVFRKEKVDYKGNKDKKEERFDELDKSYRKSRNSFRDRQSNRFRDNTNRSYNHRYADDDRDSRPRSRYNSRKK